MLSAELPCNFHLNTRVTKFMVMLYCAIIML